MHKAFSQPAAFWTLSMLSGLEENMVTCTFITTGAYIAGNVISNVYEAGYGGALDYPHVSTMKTAAFYDGCWSNSDAQ